MTIGKLPATGPPHLPHRKTRKPRQQPGWLPASKPARTACRQSPSSPNPGVPKTISSAIGRTGAPDAPPGPVAPPRPSGRSRTPHPPSRLRDRRKTSEDRRARLMRRRPVQAACVRQAGPGAIETADAPAGGPGARNFWNQQKTQSVGKPTPSTTASPIHWQARSGAVEADRSFRARRRTKARPSYPRPGQQPAQDPGLTQFQKDLAGWSSSKVALLSKEYVSTITAQHIRLLSRETTELLNGVNLTRDAAGIAEAPDRTAESELRIRPAAARAIVLPVPCARWRSSAMRCRQSTAGRGGTASGIAVGTAWRARRTMRTPSHWHNPPPQDHRSCIERRDRERRERADRHAEADHVGPLEQPDRLERFDPADGVPDAASSRLSRWTSRQSRPVGGQHPALYRLPLQALNLSGTNVTRYPEDDRPPQTARTPGHAHGVHRAAGGRRHSMEGPADALARRHQAIPQDQTAYQAWQRVLFGNQVSDISLARAGMGEYLMTWASIRRWKRSTSRKRTSARTARAGPGTPACGSDHVGLRLDERPCRGTDGGPRCRPAAAPAVDRWQP